MQRSTTQCRLETDAVTWQRRIVPPLGPDTETRGEAAASLNTPTYVREVRDQSLLLLIIPSRCCSLFHKETAPHSNNKKPAHLHVFTDSTLLSDPKDKSRQQIFSSFSLNSFGIQNERIHVIYSVWCQHFDVFKRHEMKYGEDRAIQRRRERGTSICLCLSRWYHRESSAGHFSK